MKRFTSLEVSKQTGATLRQLQWWDEKGIVTPVIRGHCRLYSEKQVGTVRRLVALRRCGMGLKDARGWAQSNKWLTACVIDGPEVIDGVLVIPKGRQR